MRWNSGTGKHPNINADTDSIGTTLPLVQIGLSLTLRVQFHTRLKTAKFLQCISIAFVPKFAYKALCSDCERLATFYMVVILDSER